MKLETKWKPICPGVQKTPGLHFPLPKPESRESWMKGMVPLFSPNAHMHLLGCVRKFREADVEDMCHPASKFLSFFEYPDFLLGQFAIVYHLGGWAIPGDSHLLLPATVNI